MDLQALGGGVSHDYVYNGFGFNDNLQHKQQQFMEEHHPPLKILQQRNQNFCFKNTSLLPENNNPHQTMVLSHSIAAHVEKQRQELDRFICLQNEKLRLGLSEQRKQQLVTISEKYESKAQVLLGQKDEEIAKVVNRRVELENLLGGMEIEGRAWHRLAKENEAMVMSLNNTIQQLRTTSVRLSSDVNGAEDAASCCDLMVMEKRENTVEDAGAGENRGGFQENEEERRKMICRRCNCRSSCVIFLPCRHLCSCKACEALFDFCPICRMVKKSSIEALF